MYLPYFSRIVVYNLSFIYYILITVVLRARPFAVSPLDGPLFNCIIYSSVGGEPPVSSMPSAVCTTTLKLGTFTPVGTNSWLGSVIKQSDM
jgi:hypothetical protein